MKLKLDDFLNYKYLSSLSYSPDGKHAAFVVSECDSEMNSYKSFLWLYTDGGAVRQLTGGGSERSFIWEDDEHILFSSIREAADKKRAERGESFTIWYRICIHGGEAQKAFELPVQAQSIQAVGGDGLYAVTASVDANFSDYYKMSDEEKAKVHDAYDKEKDYHVLDETMYWQNGGGFTNKQRNALFVYDSVNKQLKKITERFADVSDVCVKNQYIYYLAETFETKRCFKDSVYKYDTVSGETVCLYDGKAYDMSKIDVVDGRIVILASDGRRYGCNEHPWIYTLDENAGELKVFFKTEHAFWGTVGSDCRYGGARSVKALGDKLYFISTRGFISGLYMTDKSGAECEAVLLKGSVDDFDISENSREILVIGMHEGRLQEIYAVCDGQIRQLTHFNDDILKDKYVADYEYISVESQGEQIDGWILKPADYDAAKTYPAILDIHGGPETVYGEVFYHEMQYWANEGYFVFFCNPRGSDGKGNEFADIRGKYGTVDYENLMDFTDAVLKKYPQISRTQLAVTGGSYGGFMTNWIVGHTDRFACAATQRSISNWISFYGISDIGTFFGTDQTAGDIYEKHDKMWQASPLKYADKVTTPLLFIHSDEDFRCPISEGLQFYTALADRGVPVRMCWFKGENHELSRSGKPLHRVRRLEEITEWIKKYTLA